MRGKVELACGRCPACRVRRKQEWVVRILLEASVYQASTFCTMTYAEEHLPRYGSLSKVHWREFSHRIGLRYFGVGEYGDRSHRAHYHAILFGLAPLTAEAFLPPRWPYGFVAVQPFHEAAAKYVAGYTVKKLSRSDDDRLEEGQVPEFAVMSRRPAVGAYGLNVMYRWLDSPVGRDYVAKYRDVPPQIHFNGKPFPLNRTMRNYLRRYADLPESDPLRGVGMADYAEKFSLVPSLCDDKELRRTTQFERLSAQQFSSKGRL